MPRSGGVDVKKERREEGMEGRREKGRRAIHGRRCSSQIKASNHGLRSGPQIRASDKGLARIAQFLAIPLSFISPFFHLVALFL
jgi:hypothetical protein